MLKRHLLAGVILAGLLSPANAQTRFFVFTPTATTNSLTPGVQTLKIGAGGYATGLDIAVSDGTMVSRHDSYGSYFYNTTAPNPGNAGGTGAWQELVTTTAITSVPFNDGGPSYGVVEDVIAPSNTNTAYMYFLNEVWYTTNLKSGSPTWAGTNFNTAAGGNSIIGSNSNNRTFGPFIAVDPVNPNIVYAAGLDGVYHTSGGTTGGTWTKASGITSPTNTGGDSGRLLIAFDPTTSTSASTPGIYISSYGTGVYHTINASSYSLLSGTPTTHQHLHVLSNGLLLETDNSGNLNIWNGAAWSQNPGSISNVEDVAVDPNSLTHWAAVSSGGGYWSSTTSGASWSHTGSPGRTATDIPWLANWSESNAGAGTPVFMSTAALKFDNLGNVFLSEGTGIWTIPFASMAGGANWSSKSAGIEQLVSYTITAPWGTGAVPIVGVEDRGVFALPSTNTYPLNYGPTYGSGNLLIGYALDWLVGTPQTVVAIADSGPYSGTGGANNQYSSTTNGGSSWTNFTSLPSVQSGGASVAQSTTAGHWLWLQNTSTGDIYYTKNGGASWTDVVIGGVPNNPSVTGWGNIEGSAFIPNETIACDRVTADQCIAYNTGQGTAAAEGIWKTLDGGATWNQFAHGVMILGFEGIIQFMPGVANNVCATPGIQEGGSHPTTATFLCSTNAGQTWADVSNGSYTVREVGSFSFGAPKPGSGQSVATYIYGWVNGVGGIWRSTDGMATWQQLTGLQVNSSWDGVRVIAADGNTYGKVYIGFTGSGFAQGQFN